MIATLFNTHAHTDRERKSVTNIDDINYDDVYEIYCKSKRKIVIGYTVFVVDIYIYLWCQEKNCNH